MAKVIHTPAGTAPVVPVMMIGFGAYLTWFGVHYWRTDIRYPTDPLKNVLTGKGIPAADRAGDDAAMKGVRLGAQAYAGAHASGSGTADGGGASPGPVGSGSADADKIVAAALRYIGQGYVFGGPADRPGNWDCSSFVSYVLGHDLGLPLPGGKWGDAGMPPHTHGPATGNYMLWGKPVNTSEVKKGDLAITSQHMGIVTGDDSYISAKNPQSGTGLGLFSQGFSGGSPIFRRVV